MELQGENRTLINTRSARKRVPHLENALLNVFTEKFFRNGNNFEELTGIDWRTRVLRSDFWRADLRDEFITLYHLVSLNVTSDNLNEAPQCAPNLKRRLFRRSRHKINLQAFDCNHH